MAKVNEPIQTIDQIIGGNLRVLREREALTLKEAAETVALLTGRSLTESSLSRWEGGYNQFSAADLYMWSQIYSVNAIALLQPQPHVTHIRIYNRDVPTELYAYDFFIDPRGTFTERARRLLEREKHRGPDIGAALDDIQDRLNVKAGLADLHAALVNSRKMRDAMKASPDKPAAQIGLELHDAGEFLATTDQTERLNDGIAQEDE